MDEPRTPPPHSRTMRPKRNAPMLLLVLGLVTIVFLVLMNDGPPVHQTTVGELDASIRKGFVEKLVVIDSERIEGTYKRIRDLPFDQERFEIPTTGRGQANRLTPERLDEWEKLLGGPPAAHVAGYWALDGEIALHRWQLQLPEGLTYCLPVLAGDVLRFAPWRPGQPLREAMECVNRDAQAHDSVLEVGVAHQVLLMYADPDKSLRMSASFQLGADLASKLDTMQPRWVVVEYPRKVKDGQYAVLRDRGYLEVATFHGWADWDHGDVVVYGRR